MKFLKLITILFIFFGNIPYKNAVHAEIKNPEDFKVLSNESKKLSVSNVEYFIKEGDKYIKNGDFEKAKDFYLDARKLAKQLASFYSDLNSSFKGISLTCVGASHKGNIGFLPSFASLAHFSSRA